MHSGALFTDDDFAALFPTRGQPAEAPWRLALILVMQYVEDLSDRQAADAVRSRIDWKYALSLELADPGFDSTVLSEFRTRLVTGAAEQRILDAILTKCREHAWLTARGRQRTDSTHVLAQVRAVNRLECVGETLRHALNRLATVAPEWLQAIVCRRGGSAMGGAWTIPACPPVKRTVSAYAQEIGADGYALLAALYAPQAPVWLREEPAVETLRRVWVQQFYREADCVRWRTEHEGIPPAGTFISSPYDTEARYAKKHTTSWVGYKVHVTETCEDDAPHVITHVETTAGPVATGPSRPVSMRPSPTQAFCLAPISWIPAIWTPNCWPPVSASTASTCSGRRAPITNGKRKRRRGLMSAISRLTGSITRRPVREGGRASTGRRRWMTAPMRW